MNIAIRQIDEHNFADVNRCDSTFTVDSKLVLQAENNVIRYIIVAVPPYQKHYPPEELDYPTYLHDPAKAIFCAYADGQLAGQVIVRKYWNGFAYIDDIAVAVDFRRLGVGWALLQRVVTWARENQLAGIMLETQNNNVAACRLYESCGFKLGGFDRNLYRGLHPDTEEVALYWHLIFAETE